MIHKIKALYDQGNGLTIRAIARQLGISRNTVRKYLRMDETAIAEQQESRVRHRQLDDHRDCIISLLGQFPDLSAVKVLRKLKQKTAYEMSCRLVGSEMCIRDRHIELRSQTPLTDQQAVRVAFLFQ